jgi:imidazole glycerol-phosphate synthase subunit HisH
MNIAIINYGIGNLASIANMLKKVGASAQIVSDVSLIAKADKLILPGVGAFDHGMLNLKQAGLIEILNDIVLAKSVPILGICLGMQLMTKRSEEGALPGLGWVDAETVRFKFEKEEKYLKIPHMGWNTVKFCKNTDLFKGIQQEPRFYFVHSYHAVCKNDEDILTKTMHGYEFVSSFSHKNITGVQFHPEKSHKYGMDFLRNWALS